MSLARRGGACDDGRAVKIRSIVVLLSALAGLVSPAPAAEPRAGEWLADCRAYLAVLAGEDGSDLDITYCTGLTRGVLAGLGTGAGIGAVSMASALTVLAGLPESEVRKVIEGMDRNQLLGICAPGDLPIADVVQTVAGYLDKRPQALTLPVTAAFFEALQARHPCYVEEEPAEELSPKE